MLLTKSFFTSLTEEKILLFGEGRFCFLGLQTSVDFVLFLIIALNHLTSTKDNFFDSLAEANLFQKYVFLVIS